MCLKDTHENMIVLVYSLRDKTTKKYGCLKNELIKINSGSWQTKSKGYVKEIAMFGIAVIIFLEE